MALDGDVAELLSELHRGDRVLISWPEDGAQDMVVEVDEVGPGGGHRVTQREYYATISDLRRSGGKYCVYGNTSVSRA